MDYDNKLERLKSFIIDKFYKREIVSKYITLTQSDLVSINEEFEGVSKTIQEDISELFKLYGVNLVFLEHQLMEIDHGSWSYTCQPLYDRDLDYYLPLFFTEFSLYPVSFIRKLGLSSIYLVNSLTFRTKTYSQYRAGVPDYTPKVMSMIYCCKERSKSYIANVIHHELFHFFDFVEDGKIYERDFVWEEMNPHGFTYGNGGAMNRTYVGAYDTKGFLNFYSTTGIEEDKAEIFSYMMVNPAEALSSECEIIKAKVRHIKSMLTNFDYEGFGNEAYWEKLIQKRTYLSN